MVYDARGNLLTSTEESIDSTSVFSYEPDPWAWGVPRFLVTALAVIFVACI